MGSGKAGARLPLHNNPEWVYNRLSLIRARKPILLGILLIATLSCAALAYLRVNDKNSLALDFSVEPSTLPADGAASATIFIRTRDDGAPSVAVSGNRNGAVIRAIERVPDGWKVRVRSGVLPGVLTVRLQAPGHRAASAHLTLISDSNDSFGDGTPDFLRLHARRDRESFRRWFVWLAEAEYFEPPEARPTEIDDCAALVRFAYREALSNHEGGWADSIALPQSPAMESVTQYQYPSTPLGAALFRVKPGPYRAEDNADGTFLQFADAKTIWRFNTHPVGRDLALAQPGDLLVFRQPHSESGHETFHVMIYVGHSVIRPDGRSYLVYHTGPVGSGAAATPGEMRRPTVEDLLRFPQPEWRPVASNPAFLGVMRWNILRRSSGEPDE